MCMFMPADVIIVLRNPTGWKMYHHGGHNPSLYNDYQHWCIKDLVFIKLKH